jgi:hypothetical protein
MDLLNGITSALYYMLSLARHHKLVIKGFCSGCDMKGRFTVECSEYSFRGNWETLSVTLTGSQKVGFGQIVGKARGMMKKVCNGA